ncbi:MAG: hypothetical protein KatS3mg110_1175 [Pirellulaceae bacterium]|nr:MAG: hypothetical protein KatS3mg110_1175 [Pirellulaceae bacterium]
MATFRTHIAVSSTLGALYCGAGHAAGIPLTSAVIGGGVCAVAGMLPDLDSDSGVPYRETISLAAAVVPLLLLDRLRHWGLDHEQMVISAAGAYLFVRFVVGPLFRWYTVHRGMWHSVPAAVIAALVVYLLCGCQVETIRWFKACGAWLGFMSHLVLDEWYSIELSLFGLRFKRSFGTALKLWGRSRWANISTYAKLVLLACLATGDVHYFQPYWEQYHQTLHTAGRAIDENLQPTRTR